MPRLEQCVESIEAAYARLGHQVGWRFLAGPRRTLTADTRFAFITLNPGGTHEDPAHPRSSSEDGNAYWIESWKGYPVGTAPLQFQVQELFARIARIVGATEPARDFVETRVLMAHFIPFRSPNLDSLHRRTESIAYAHQLWSRILAVWTPRTILTIDRETFKNLYRIISDRSAALPADRRFPTGWGNYTAETSRFLVGARSDEVVTLARLPHLSRFHLMSKEACRQPIQEFLDYVYAPGSQEAVKVTSSSTTSPEDRRQRTPTHRGRRIPRDADDTDEQGRTRRGDSTMFEHFRDHIQAEHVRAAYDHFLWKPHFALIPKWSGKPSGKRSVAFTRSGEPKGGYYSFIVNRSHLRFYIRKPAWCDEWTEQQDALEARFRERFVDNTGGEWCVDVYSIDDVQFLETLSKNTPYPLRRDLASREVRG